MEYHLGINVNGLSDLEWAEKYSQLLEIREDERKRSATL